MVAQSNPHQCLDCTKEVYGRTLRCEDHRKAKKNKTRNDFMAAQRAALKGIKGGPLPPQRKPPKIVKTSQQVDAECRKAEAKMREVRERLNPQLMAVRTLPTWMQGQPIFFARQVKQKG